MLNNNNIKIWQNMFGREWYDTAEGGVHTYMAEGGFPLAYIKQGTYMSKVHTILISI